MSADRIAALEAENAQLRRFIAASEKVADANAAVEYQRLYDDLRARCTKMIDDLTTGATINLGICPFCGESWPTTGVDREGRASLAAAHDQRCPRNPIRLERDALRDAVLRVADAQIGRRREMLEVWAIRAAANDLSEPFSEARVQERLEEMLAEEPSR